MDTEIDTPVWHDERHHTSDGFTNIWGEPRDVPALKAARWLLGRPFENKNNVTPAVHRVDPETLRERPERVRLTWIGHSAMLVQTRNADLLLDPMFGDRASPVSFAGPARETPLPLSIDELHRVDVVLISHDHYDHLDKGSVRHLERRFSPLFLVPLGVGETIRDWGASRVVEMDWWQRVDVEGLRIHCTPARHFSGRGPLDRDETLWSGWYVEAEDLRLYYAGDTGYASLFNEIRERLGAPEIALLPIGAYLPRWFMKPVHVNPQEAVQAFLDLQARYFIPVHWGVFDLADEALQDPPRELRAAAVAAGIEDSVHLLDVGGTFTPPSSEASGVAEPAASTDAP